MPTILQMIVDKLEAGGTYLLRWKVIVGGSALPVVLARSAIERGIDIIAGYGMSETCPVLTLAHLRSDMKDVERRATHRRNAAARAARSRSCTFASWMPK